MLILKDEHAIDVLKSGNTGHLWHDFHAIGVHATDVGHPHLRLIATVWSLPRRDLLQVNFCPDEAPTHFWAKLASQIQPNLLSLTSYIKNVALFRDVLQLFQI